ncbi:hypothetical protein GCM10009663_32040 [Kitasatospora arboriphila]|uniref:Uncharacterized protein n=1 Tax=Kitasatospora arboriphila TaxID=258052 RepID=A0ABP4E5L2_9ACTN
MSSSLSRASDLREAAVAGAVRAFMRPNPTGVRRHPGVVAVRPVPGCEGASPAVPRRAVPGCALAPEGYPRVNYHC